MSTYTDMLAEFGEDIPYNRVQEFDEARADHNEDVVAAAEALADRWADRHLSADVGPKLTCGELVPLLDLLTALGREDVAESWLHGHGVADDDEYDDHHDVYLSNQES